MDGQDRRKLSVDQLAQLEQYENSQEQLKTLKELSTVLTSVKDAINSKNNDDISKVMGEVNKSVVALKNKQDPKMPDMTTPIVQALTKLGDSFSKAINSLELSPNIDVAAPNIDVKPATVDLSKVEKILKNDLPAAFSQAISAIPTPVADVRLNKLTDIIDWLKSIDTASRLKVQIPSTMKVTNPDGSPIGGGSITNYALETGGNLATISAKDFATQTTLALIKAKTDNIDVALSTRTKPADAQHVIVDSGVTTGLTDTQLRATPVPVSGTVTANLGTIAGVSTAAKQLPDNHNVVVTSAPTTAVTGTFFQATQPVSAASLPLPSGASTAANQTTGNSSLSSIDAKLSGTLITSTTGTVGSVSAVVNVGQQTVNTTAVQISASSTVPTNGILVGALSTNSAPIFIGGSGVTTSNGAELLPGASLPFTCNLNTLYIRSAASTTDKVYWNVA